METSADPTLTATLSRNLAVVRDRIAQAASSAGRPEEEVRLVAVSKTFPIEHIRAAAEAGLRDLGENRVQEALKKIGEVSELDIGWHLVGHLQSNKAHRAAGAFAWIHSVDSVALLERLDEAAASQRTAPRLLVQVDLSGEVTKHGASESETRQIFDAASRCHAARVVGLMVLPPWSKNPEHARPYFRRLREIGLELKSQGVPGDQTRELSMGMSNDLEVAIQEGSTLVRVGTALFGRRTPPS